MRAKIQKFVRTLKTSKMLVSFLMVLVCLGIFVLPKPSYAGVTEWIANGLAWAVYLIFGWIIQLISVFVGHLMIGVVEILIEVVQFNDFIYHPVVVTGWELTRDICNMFFVLILLVIAIGTIFRAENYHYRRMLPRLLITIVVVNFSKVIAGFIIDFAQVFMLTFATAIAPTVAGNLFNKFGIDSLYDINNVVGAQSKKISKEGYDLLFLTLSLLLGFVMIVVAFFVLLAYLVIFLLRIIALWVLIVLAPIAFLLSTFSRGQSYYREWWDTFINYVIAGPVLIFFFWLALTAEEKALQLNTLSQLKLSPEKLKELGVDASELATQIGYTQAGTKENVAKFIVTTALLMGGLVAAQRVQVAGASFASQIGSGLRKNWGGLRPIIGRPASKVLGGAKWVGKEALGYGVSEVRASLGLPSFQEIKEGWQKSSLKREEKRAERRDKKAGQLGEKSGFINQLRSAWSSPEHFFNNVMTRRTLTPAGLKTLRGAHYLDSVKKIDALKEQEKEAKAKLAGGADALEVGLSTVKNEAEKDVTKKTETQLHNERLGHTRDNQMVIENRGNSERETEVTFGSFKKKENLQDADISTVDSEGFLKADGSVDYAKIKGKGYTKDEEQRITKTTEKLSEWQRMVEKDFDAEMKDAGVDRALDIESSAAPTKYYKDGKIMQTDIDAITDVELRERVQKKANALHKYDEERALKMRDSKQLVEKEVDSRLSGFGTNKDTKLAEIGRKELRRRSNEAKKRATLLDLSQKGPSGRNILNEEEVVERKSVIEQKKRELIKAERQSKVILADPKATTAQKTAATDYVTGLQNELKELEKVIKIPVEFIDVDTGAVRSDFVEAYQATEEQQKRLDDDRKIYERDKNKPQEKREETLTAKRIEKEEKTKEESAQFERLSKKSVGTTVEERQKLEKEIEKYGKKIHELTIEAEQYKPFIDYPTRRDRRERIDKEKSSFRTDSWQELFTIYQDAVRRDDGIRAAAAFMKATESGNENEFLNSLGYDSGATGMKDFVEIELIKKLNMDRELAMNIANDVSYIGEKGYHWGVARAVGTDRLGRQQWQSEMDREMEVLAEVRKTDFENFMRRANRLAYGKETPQGETSEERMSNFARTGQRSFRMDNFGSTFFMENFHNFQSLLNRGRFNINLGVNVGSDANVAMLKQIAHLSDHPEAVGRMLNQLRSKYNSGARYGRGPFDRFTDIYRELSSRS